MAKKNPGRKTYSNEEKKKKIEKYLELVKEGTSKVEAAKKVNVSYITLRKWTEGDQEEIAEPQTESNTELETEESNESEVQKNSIDMEAVFSNLVANVRQQVVDEMIEKLKELR